MQTLQESIKPTWGQSSLSSKAATITSTALQCYRLPAQSCCLSPFFHWRSASSFIHSWTTPLTDNPTTAEYPQVPPRQSHYVVVLLLHFVESFFAQLIGSSSTTTTSPAWLIRPPITVKFAYPCRSVSRPIIRPSWTHRWSMMRSRREVPA